MPKWIQQLKDRENVVLSTHVRCDGQRPCQRCEKNGAECEYFDTVKDANVLRIERLEKEVENLKSALTTYRSPMSDEFASVSPALPNQLGALHYLVPIFCSKIDTLESVVTRSAFLFDTITSIGCRAEEGSNSSAYHHLSSCVREHLTHALINTAAPSLETVQAIAVRAAYSDEGLVYIALALRFAMQLGLPDAVERLVAMASSRGTGVPVDEGEKELYRLARVWFGICNLELFFSLDGGKLPSIILRTSSRRIRLLTVHPEQTAVDLRLLSQIELNLVRANAYSNIAHQYSNVSPASDAHLRSTVHSTAVELALWLEEWVSIIGSLMDEHERELALLNLRIQYNWALITLHLKALSETGIDNITIMTGFQREMVRIAKEAAIAHLHHLLERPSSLPPDIMESPPYLAAFKYTMDYVWAKCAFSILLVLKLALLLRDPHPTVLVLLQSAYTVLEELRKVTVGRGNSGNVSYLRILQTSIEKCEGALREFMEREEQQLGLDGEVERRDGAEARAEDDFQGYAPSEFIFEWDFPGLNLRCVPLGWQDLFVDLDHVF
ncbi:C6 zinc finger domain-containing protein [Byssothecium circinans]|uniref:C6 zinc finger domain-containing protein n=1 Tax=Byssothecium circinans TaxID=147558 RepID=A0A6A5UD82_9PLEO|nr:C6 zinc finger domain-containing protein [Byssothecium circinans]